MISKEEAFEAYWQGYKDIDPMIPEVRARHYFERWWDKRSTSNSTSMKDNRRCNCCNGCKTWDCDKL